MKKWRYISDQNSEIVGIHDAGIETFTANIYRSLVRESIQNSLDAKIDDYDGPVYVEFMKFDILKEDFPDYDGFLKSIRKCIDSNSNEPDAKSFFDKAENILCGDNIPVLRISDCYTKGLEGTEKCEKGSNWSRLVKENGSSNKGQSSG